VLNNVLLLLFKDKDLTQNPFSKILTVIIISKLVQNNLNKQWLY